MPLTTPAVVFESPKNVSFREIQVPDPGERDLLIRTEWSLISNGTESSFLRGERIAGDTPALPGETLPFPQVPGYQRVGVVEKCGSRVTRFKKGDHVFVAMTPVLGMRESQGGHVALGPVHEEFAHPIPTGLDPKEAAGLVLTQVGFNCGMRFPAAIGDAVLVIGDGLVGLWAAQTLAARNLVVFLLGRHESRMKRLSLSHPHQTLAASGVKAATLAAMKSFLSDRGRPGFHAFIDTVGDNDFLLDAFDHFLREGHLVSAGFLGNAGAIDIQKLRLKEASLHSPSGWTETRLAQTLELIRLGKMSLTPFVSHTFPASEAPKAYQMILDKKENHLGILLDWRSL